MSREIIDKWLAAMISGEYNWCCGVLKTDIIKHGRRVCGHCALGVLADLMHLRFDETGRLMFPDGRYDDDYEQLREVLTPLGIRTDTVYMMNDNINNHEEYRPVIHYVSNQLKQYDAASTASTSMPTTGDV